MAALCLLGLAASAQAQSIYTCVDSSGRRITADRPIPECLDRAQKELNPSGSLRRTVGPSLTGPERAAQLAREKAAAEEQARAEEARRRDRALLIRYPNAAVHDKELADAVAHIDVSTVAAQKRLEQLAAQKKALDTELEFYRHDPSKVPPTLKRRVEENAQHQQAQHRFIEKQTREKDRIGARFKQEREKLKTLWAPVSAAAAPAAP